MRFHLQFIPKFLKETDLWELLSPFNVIGIGNNRPDPTPKPMPSKVTSSDPIAKNNSSPQEQFFNQYAPYAILTQEMTHIPASVTLAQAALESGFGKHAPGNNFFGIKGMGSAGSQILRTWEVKGGKKVRVKARFRIYDSPLESFLDHAKVIANGRYLKHAMDHTGSAEEFITALQSKKTRYATDPNYSKKILKLIHQFQLERFDKP